MQARIAAREARENPALRLEDSLALLISGIRSLYAGQPSFKGLNNTLVWRANALPPSMKGRRSPAIEHAQTGGILVTPTKDFEQFQLYFGDVSGHDCRSLIAFLADQTRRFNSLQSVNNVAWNLGRGADDAKLTCAGSGSRRAPMALVLQ